MEKYYIYIDCCRSGQCLDCLHLPAGKKVRRAWSAEPVDKKTAEVVARGWKDFNPEIVTEFKGK